MDKTTIREESELFFIFFATLLAIASLLYSHSLYKITSKLETLSEEIKIELAKKRLKTSETSSKLLEKLQEKQFVNIIKDKLKEK